MLRGWWNRQADRGTNETFGFRVWGLEFRV